MTPSKKVLVERQGPVLIVRINRPEVRNAIDTEVSNGIASAMDELDQSASLRVGVIAGVGNSFSAGMDLKAFVGGETPMIQGRGLGGITESPPKKPLIGAAQGWALGGGLELLLACDLIVADTSTQLGFPEVRRSLIAAAGGVMLLPDRIPFAIAMEMLFTGEPIDAHRATDLGLVNRLVPSGQSLETALNLANVVAANGPLAVVGTKEIVNRRREWPIADRWRKQREISDPINRSDDAREGAAAFREGRTPTWGLPE